MQIAEFLKTCQDLEDSLALLYRSLRQNGKLGAEAQAVFADREQEKSFLE